MARQQCGGLGHCAQGSIGREPQCQPVRILDTVELAGDPQGGEPEDGPRDRHRPAPLGEKSDDQCAAPRSQHRRGDELGMALGFANAWWLFLPSAFSPPAVTFVSGVLTGLMLCTSPAVFLAFTPFLAALWLLTSSSQWSGR